MKCKSAQCQNEVPKNLVKTGFVYCSRSCAPFGNLGLANPTQSTPSRSIYSTKGHGVPSAPSSAGEKPQADNGSYSESYLKDIRHALRPGSGKRLTTPDPISPSSDLTERKKRENCGPTPTVDPTRSDGPPSETKTEITPERCGESGMPETENSTALTKSEGDGSETLPTASSSQPINFAAERSHTMSLIDESAEVLLDCMKSASKQNEMGERQIRDFRHLNAICNAGKQIAQLAKVKLDAIKEARK